MKKTYQIPTTQVIEVKLQGVIATSFKGEVGTEGVDGSASLSGSYRNSLWGDDE